MSAKRFFDIGWSALMRTVPAGRVSDVGWLIDAERAGFIWEAPTRLRLTATDSRHAKSVTACPAVIDQESRYFVVPCPISARLKVRIDPSTGEATVANAAGDQSAIRTKSLGELVKRVNAREWRHPDRPMLQFVTPYVFIADDPVYMNQLPPFAFRPDQPLPGLMIGGRFPIDVWPRHLMWAFEWHNTDEELVLRRGDPWFYVGFETEDPSSRVRLVEAEFTPALKEYMAGTRSVTNFVSQTFSLFKTARERRPKKLLVKKDR